VFFKFTVILPINEAFIEIMRLRGFGGLGVACWPLVPQFAASCRRCRYERLWWYNWSSWWWAACCSKHGEECSV